MKVGVGPPILTLAPLGPPSHTKLAPPLHRMVSVSTSTVPAVETSLHPTHPQSLCPHTARRLPPYLHHSSPDQSHGEDLCPALHVPSLPVTPSNPLIHRSVCLPSNWLPSSCNHLPPQQHHQPAHLQPIRHSHLPGLQQGV